MPFALASILFIQNKFKQAANFADQAIKCNLKMKVPAKFFGVPLHYFEKSIEQLKRRIKTDPTNHKLQFLLGFQYCMQNRPKLARKHLQKTLQLQPNYVSAKKLLASLKSW